MSNARPQEIDVKAPAQATPAVYVTESGRKSWHIYQREMATYLRELPRLLAEGREGHYTLVHGDEIIGVWQEQRCAIQEGCDRYGLDPIFVKKINPRDPELYAEVKRQMESSCPS